MSDIPVPLMTRQDYEKALAEYKYAASDPELLAAVVREHRATLTAQLIARVHGKLLRDRAKARIVPAPASAGAQSNRL